MNKTGIALALFVGLCSASSAAGTSAIYRIDPSIFGDAVADSLSGKANNNPVTSSVDSSVGDTSGNAATSAQTIVNKVALSWEIKDTWDVIDDRLLGFTDTFVGSQSAVAFMIYNAGPSLLTISSIYSIYNSYVDPSSAF